MLLEVRKLAALLVLCSAVAVAASACGDDTADSGSSSGTGGGSGTSVGPTASSSSTESTGTGGDDPCAEVPEACFDASLCYGAPPVGVSLRNDLLPIMERSCGFNSGCHSDKRSPTTTEGYKPYLATKPGEGETDVAILLAAIVDVEAWGDPSRPVVDPGNWENSYFMNKLDGALDQCGDLDCLDCGRLMPQGSPIPLPIEERNLFRAWIQDGAQDN